MRSPHQCSTCRLSSVARRAIADYTPVLEEPEKSGKPGDADSVGAIILGGGAGTRLRPLTSRRAKPAVPIGGAYRLIDVPMSNCLNSGINKIYILTQYNSTSLNRHMSRTYNVPGVTTRGFVEVLAASQSPGDTNWCACCPRHPHRRTAPRAGESLLPARVHLSCAPTMLFGLSVECIAGSKGQQTLCGSTRGCCAT